MSNCASLHWLAISLFGMLLGCGDKAGNSTAFRNPQAMEQAHLIISASDPRIAVMGRTETLENGRVRFAYPGVTLKFTAEGRSGFLLASSSTSQSYLDIILDGGKPRAVKLTTSVQPIPLFSGEEREKHTVEIIHRSETWHGVVTVQSVELSDGELLAAPRLPTQRLLILGDSVTCGEAIERTSECKKDTSWWNLRLSYGMLAAKALDAQVHLVCFGGRGLIRSWNGKTDEQNLPDYFELAIADAQNPIPWDHDRYSPDTILSAIGTNDFSEGIPDRETYVNAYVKLIHRLFEVHPQARIALTEGAILSGDKKAALSEYLAETVRRIDHPYVYVIPSAHYPGDDCDAHPTKAQHAAMAEDLVRLLSTNLKRPNNP